MATEPNSEDLSRGSKELPEHSPTPLKGEAEATNNGAGEGSLVEKVEQEIEASTSNLSQLIIQHEIDEWMKSRTELTCNGLGHTPSQEKLAEIDHALERRLTELLINPVGALDFELISQTLKDNLDPLLEKRVEDAQERHAAQWRETGEKISAIWEQIGECHGRSRDEKREHALLEEWEKLKSELSAKFTILVGTGVSADEAKAELQEAVQTIQREAERLGEVRYLEADERASRLKATIGKLGIDTDEMVSILSDLDKPQLNLLFQTFEEKYGTSFDQMREDAYKDVTLKFLNFFRLNIIEDFFKDSFGAGAAMTEQVAKTANLGLIKLIREKPWRELDLSFAGMVQKLRDKVKGYEEARIESLLDGHKLTAATDSIFLALWDKPILPFLPRKSEPAEVVASTILKISREEREQLEEDFNARYTEKFDGTTLREIMRDRFGEVEAAYLEARLDGERSLALAKLLQVGSGRRAPWSRGRRAEFYQALREVADLSDEERLATAKAFERDTGTTVQQLADELGGPSGDWLRETFSLASDATFRREAARLRCAMKRYIKDFPEAILYELELDENQQVIELYDQMYDTSFIGEYRKKMGTDGEKGLLSYLDDGKLKRAEMVRDTLMAFKVDYPGLVTLLSHRTCEEQQTLQEDYSTYFRRFATPGEVIENIGGILSEAHEGGSSALRALFKCATSPRQILTYPRELRTDLMRKLGGYRRHEALRLLEGDPDSVEALFKQFLSRYKIDHAGKSLSLAVDPDEPKKPGPMKRFFMARTAGTSLEKLFFSEDLEKKSKLRDCHAVGKFYETELKPKLERGEQIERKELLQFKRLIKIAFQSLDTHRERRKDRANLVANIGELAVLPSTSLILGPLGLPIVPTMAAVTGIVWAYRAGVKLAVLKNGYEDRDALFIDGSLAAASGVSLGGSRYALQFGRYFLGSPIGRKVAGSFLKFVIKTSWKQLNNTVVSPRILSDRKSGMVELASKREQAMFLENKGRHIETTLHAQLKESQVQETMNAAEVILNRFRLREEMNE